MSTAPSSGNRAALAERLCRGAASMWVRLGQAFVSEPSNEGLRRALSESTLSAAQYGDQLLCAVLRVLVLLVLEARELLHPPDVTPRARRLYQRKFALLRPGVSGAPRAGGSSWRRVARVFAGLAGGEPRLGLSEWAGLFESRCCADVECLCLARADWMDALLPLWSSLSCEESPIARTLSSLSPEDLAHVYQELLQWVPRIELVDGHWHFRADARAPVNARRGSGSYYTPAELIDQVLSRALETAIVERLAANPGETPPAGTAGELALPGVDAQARDRVLSLRIVDPACGAGNFLLAAARYLAERVLAEQRSLQPDSARRMVMRQVLTEVIHGVDLDPVAVALCRACLWLEAADVTLSPRALEPQVRVGNALFGATPALLAGGVPDGAWAQAPGENAEHVRGLLARNRAGRGHAATQRAEQRLFADAWCAAFVWPREDPEACAAAPTNERWARLLDPAAGAEPGMNQTVAGVQRLRQCYQFFHWHLEFQEIIDSGGFDVVLGNPPWIAHAGRAAQSLPPGVRRYYSSVFSAFRGYPTTHGLFVGHLPSVLKPGGYLGLVVPSSLSELAGYGPTRAAHDELCDVPDDLVDFGEGRFRNVTQPCMALVSRRVEGGRQGAAKGAPWPVARGDLSPIARVLLRRLEGLPRLPPELFGERGLQSDPSLEPHWCVGTGPTGRFDTPLREGADVREFRLLPPRRFADRAALGKRLRPAEQFAAVKFVLRQTARFPVAALSDGLAFRNSLIAGFEMPEWPAPALVALLNSALVRWYHFMRFRDARQPVLPQVKVSHLRAIPRPPAWGEQGCERLEELGLALGRGPAPPAFIADWQRTVCELYSLCPAEQALIRAWPHSDWPTMESAS